MITFRKLLLLIFITGIFFLIISASAPMSPRYYNSLVQPWNNLVGSSKGASALSIFTTIIENNIRVLILDTIPIFGAVFYFVSLYETAALLHVGMSSTPAFSPSVSVAAVSLFAAPDTSLEILAYTFPVTTSIYFIAKQISTRRIHPSKYSVVFSSLKDFTIYCKLLVRGFVYGFVLLVIAAVFEASVISSPLLLLVLWIPVILILLFLFSSRILQKLPERVRKFFNLDSVFTLA